MNEQQQSSSEWAQNVPAGSLPPQAPANMPLDPNMVLPSGLTVAQEEKKANTLCIISLCCKFGAPLLAVLLFAVGMVIDDAVNSQVGTSIMSVLSVPLSSARIASWVLVIVARTKYKHAKFPKVLLTIYLVLLAIGVVLAIIGIIIFALVLQEFLESLRGCS